MARPIEGSPITFTTVVHVEVFPHWSVTVNVTVFMPISPSSKLEGKIDKIKSVIGVQRSVEPLSISAAVIVASEFSSKSKSKSATHNAVGGVLSMLII